MTLPVLFCLSNYTSSSFGFLNYGEKNQHNILYTKENCRPHILKGLQSWRKEVQPRKGICMSLNYRIERFLFLDFLYSSFTWIKMENMLTKLSTTVKYIPFNYTQAWKHYTGCPVASLRLILLPQENTQKKRNMCDLSLISHVL